MSVRGAPSFDWKVQCVDAKTGAAPASSAAPAFGFDASLTGDESPPSADVSTRDQSAARLCLIRGR